MTAPTLADAGFAPEREWFVSPEHAALLAATLDTGPSSVAALALATGELPIPWHWTCFLPDAPTAALGADGHPRRRDEMAAFPNRMWVGGAVTTASPVRLGRPAVRRSELVGAEEKTGSAGRFWLVSVSHSITQEGVPCLTERQDLVLREPTPAVPPGDDAGPPERAWVEEHRAEPPLLFRYSALTFNAHRIHYDRPYATGVEGYPDLVVQGPLTATLLCELARRERALPVRGFEFRARAPLFANRRFWLTGEPTSEGASLSAVRGDGVVAMTLDVTLGPA